MSVPLKLLAVDPDEGPRGQVTYTVLSGNEAGLFELQQETGQVYVAQPLIHRAAGQHQMEAMSNHKWHPAPHSMVRMYVQASDQGKPPRTSSSVIDINIQNPFSVKTLANPANDQHVQTTDIRFQSPVIGSQNSGLARDVPMVRKVWQTRAEEISHSKGILPTSDVLTLIAMITATLAALLFICILFVVLRCRRMKAQPQRSVLQIANRSVYRDPPPSAYTKQTDRGVSMLASLALPSDSSDGTAVDKCTQPCSLFHTRFGCLGSSAASPDNHRLRQLDQMQQRTPHQQLELGQYQQPSPSTCLLSPVNKTIHDKEPFATVCTLKKLQGTPMSDSTHISDLVIYTSKWPVQASEAEDYYHTNTTANTAIPNDYSFLVHNSCQLDNSKNSACNRMLFNNSELYQKRQYRTCEKQSSNDFALLPPQRDQSNDHLCSELTTATVNTSSWPQSELVDACGAVKSSRRSTDNHIMLKDGYTSLTNNGDNLDFTLVKVSPPSTLQTTTVTTAFSHSSSFV